HPMNRNLVRTLLCLGAVGLLALFATACGSDDEETASAAVEAETMAFTLTDGGCDPVDAEAPAGPITFEVENASSNPDVHELEVLDGETVLGETPDLAEGDSGSFTLTLEQGEYTLLCPGSDGEPGTLTVSGELETENSPEVEAAIADYRSYLEENTAELVEATEPFVAAVVAGDIAKAKSLYPAARIPYERIEPVAESFGSLDPRIDARENDVPPSQFEGFHRLEKALWEEESLKGMAPVAEQLLADVEELAEKVKTVELQAVQIANGANELLGEVSASKITGEEERYSHIDLVDFEANVEGSEAAFEAVKPLLEPSNSDLAGEIEADFKMVFNSLEPYRTAAGFVPYTDLTKADTKKLAVAIDTLAEKLSLVPAEIASSEHS
ncbi:MAG TPA: iron uptake system protein EfeO, partial [Solirubrobacterales bacterium]|nr:iron uptake system protein EfeO [Solirubrobacterales bacterium]